MVDVPHHQAIHSFPWDNIVEFLVHHLDSKNHTALQFWDTILALCATPSIHRIANICNLFVKTADDFNLLLPTTADPKLEVQLKYVKTFFICHGLSNVFHTLSNQDKCTRSNPVIVSIDYFKMLLEEAANRLEAFRNEVNLVIDDICESGCDSVSFDNILNPAKTIGIGLTTIYEGIDRLLLFSRFNNLDNFTDEGLVIETDNDRKIILVETYSASLIRIESDVDVFEGNSLLVFPSSERGIMNEEIESICKGFQDYKFTFDHTKQRSKVMFHPFSSQSDDEYFIMPNKRIKRRDVNNSYISLLDDLIQQFVNVKDVDACCKNRLLGLSSSNIRTTRVASTP